MTYLINSPLQNFQLYPETENYLLWREHSFFNKLRDFRRWMYTFFTLQRIFFSSLTLTHLKISSLRTFRLYVEKKFTSCCTSMYLKNKFPISRDKSRFYMLVFLFFFVFQRILLQIWLWPIWKALLAASFGCTNKKFTCCCAIIPFFKITL